ncbi:50S ribosomal protein L11 methyltransferase [Spongiimicrobium sp. 3-5]|uniref:50S ribosomal protein L11 methyltransferase n=1 Tax=Spongiimicrobium sp. 3-5 TaxID=3332596 RepID=UPI00397ED67C
MEYNSYIAYSFKISPLQPAMDILIAELSTEGFESFVEEEDGLLAYIKKEDWSKETLNSIQILRNHDFKIQHTFSEIAQENWNAVWESSFDPIEVGKDCVVRAPFHKKPEVRFDIVIEPKMSFGTGHHETTHMMIQHILGNEIAGKSVLDMGSGTGVLAILAAMKGATNVDAIDIDHWCYLNAIENVTRNGQQHINVLEGDVALLTNRKYDIILANINRNILLNDIPIYVGCLKAKGSLFLSGFYLEDMPLISQKCKENGLKFEKNLKINNWVAVKYVF